MRAITILKRYRVADDEIERIDMAIQQKREILSGLGGGGLDGDGIRGGGDKDRTGRIYADIDLLERRKAEREQEKAVELAGCSVLLDMVPELESRILFRYYVKKMSTGDVARDLRYQANYVRRKKREAEQLLDMLYPERVAMAVPEWYIEKYPESRKERR